MEYTIQEVARVAGVSSRTLRHYGDLGLVLPSRTGRNGYRFYDDRSLIRLQRVLLLRDLGLGLEAIGRVLTAQDAEGEARGRAAAPGDARRDEARILETHLGMLFAERDRIDRQIGAVERTISALKDEPGTRPAANHDGADTRHEHIEREPLMSANIFDGFDHTAHKEEVESRWGEEAYAQSDRWWRSLSSENKEEWMAAVTQLNTDWVSAMTSGVDPSSTTAQALAGRHIAWLRSVPGTPQGDAFESYVLGLGDMYVADERFAANYGGAEGAAFVRDSLHAYVSAELTR